MALFKASNPAMKESVFSKVGYSSSQMTINGAIGKTLLLLALAVGSGAYAWKIFTDSISVDAYMPWMFAGLVGGLVMAFVVIFRPKTAPWAAPIYALFEGLFLGSISAIFEYSFQDQFPGIVITAVGITLLTLLVMLVLYRSRIIKVTNKLRSGIIGATAAVALFYLATIIMRWFGADISGVLGYSTLSIVISFVIVAIAAFNFLLDFDFIEKGAQAGAPKFMEWYGAFGLMLTIVWLYLEVLKLLARFAGRD